MKIKSYIKIAAVSLAGMATLSSCLKDNAHYVNFAGSKPLVELPAATAIGSAGGLFEPASFSIAATPTPFNVLVNLAAPKPLSTALTVKFIVDESALTAYNHSLGLDTGGNTPYVLLPPADYSSTLSATIPANQNEANLVININTSLIDPSQPYALPITISDGGGQQISNYKTIIYSILVKNKYDGKYTVTGTLTDATTATITGAYPNNVELITQGASSDAYFDTDISNYAHQINTSNGPSSYGYYAPVFTFDPTTNKIIGVV